MTDSPKRADDGRVSHAALAADDGGYGDDVVGIGRVPHSQEKAQHDDGEQRDHEQSPTFTRNSTGTRNPERADRTFRDLQWAHPHPTFFGSVDSTRSLCAMFLELFDLQELRTRFSDLLIVRKIGRVIVREMRRSQSRVAPQMGVPAWQFARR